MKQQTLRSISAHDGLRCGRMKILKARPLTIDGRQRFGQRRFQLRLGGLQNIKAVVGHCQKQLAPSPLRQAVTYGFNVIDQALGFASLLLVDGAGLYAKRDEIYLIL